MLNKTDGIYHDWDICRYISTAALNSNPYLKKAYKPRDLFELPTDNISLSEPPTKDEVRQMAMIANQFINRVKS